MRRYAIALLFLLVAAPSYGQVTATGTIDANAESVVMTETGTLGVASIQLTGTFSGTIALQCSVDGSNWLAVRITPTNTTTAVTSVTGTGVWTGTVAGCATVRATSTAWTSGSATVSLLGVSAGGGGGGSGAAASEVTVSTMPADATELPAAAAIGDNTANPTIPAIAAYMMCFDGTTWDRCTVGGVAMLSYISAGATEDEHAVCTGACTLYSILVTNINAAVRYLKCENDTAAGTAPGTDTPEFRIAVPGSTTGAGVSHNFPVGARFTTALTCWLVTGAADNDVAEVAASELLVFYTYEQ